MILNSEDYKAKIQHLLNDGSKFECSENKKLEVKKKINDIASQFKETNNDLFKVLHRTGDYANDHLYGLPKVHKNSNDPPLRPIISMSGTVAHDVSEHINTIIQPYMNTQHVIRSSDELLLKLKNLQMQDEQKFSSLDVESLFTNVPVQRIIDIIIQTAYNHETLPAPTIPQETLRELFTMCTTDYRGGQ